MIFRKKPSLLLGRLLPNRTGRYEIISLNLWLSSFQLLVAEGHIRCSAEFFFLVGFLHFEGSVLHMQSKVDRALSQSSIESRSFCF